MGFASYLEDNIEKLNERIHLAESRLENRHSTEELRREALGALGDARVLLQKLSRELGLATSPEMDLAHEISRLRSEVKSLHADLAAAQQKTERAESDRQRAKQRMHQLEKEKRELEKDFEKLSFGDALPAYMSPGLLKKHSRD